MKQLISISAIIFIVSISSCKKDSIEPIDTSSSNKLSDKWQKGYYKGELITYEKRNNMNLILGDILIPNEEISENPQEKSDKIMDGTGVTDPLTLWPNRTVRYEIDPNTTDIKREWIITAMKNWSNNTGIKFLDVSNYTNKGDYVYLVYGTNGNNSYVGRIGGMQILNLESDGVGVIVHELGHVLGMFHEQSRSDRDKYIKIIWENIQVDWTPQYFVFAFADNFLANAPRTKFDFNSIMLYAAFNTTALDYSLPVMTKMDGSTWGDNVYNGTNAPSTTDAKWVKLRYKIID